MVAPVCKRPILIVAGGTGGHVYPALAVALALQQCSHKVLWLGTRRGLESRVVPAAGVEIEWISIQGLRGKGIPRLLLAPLSLVFALGQSLSVMLRRRPAAVLGMGGFVSGPGGLAAWLTRRPLLIHEQNAVAGLTNRVLARLARVVLQAFPGSFSDQTHAVTVGNPVRQDIAAMDDPAIRYDGRSGSLRLLILGGSQGALALNRTVPLALAMLPERSRPLVRHQAGERTLQIALDMYRKTGFSAQVIPFIDDMAEAYAWADLVVCRAGALTVAEIAAAGVAAVFVPFPSAVDDHQTANALPMQRAGAAEIVDERDLSAKSLANTLVRLLQSRRILRQRAICCRSFACPGAIDRISAACLAAAGIAS